MSFSRPIQWYHYHADPICPNGNFNSFFEAYCTYKTCHSIHYFVLHQASILQPNILPYGPALGLGGYGLGLGAPGLFISIIIIALRS